jgi:hypothetical protein
MVIDEAFFNPIIVVSCKLLFGGVYAVIFYSG